MTASGGTASDGAKSDGAESADRTRHRRWRPRPLEIVLGLATALVILATLAGFVVLRDSDAAARRHQLRSDTEDAAARLQRLFGGTGGGPAAVAALFIGVDPATVTDKTFDGFIQPLLDTEAVSALEWVPRVRAADASAFVEGRRAAIPDFSLREFGPDGPQQLSARDEYFPVGFVEPLGENVAALGVDLASQPTRAAALALARDSGSYAATAPILLAQGGIGFLVAYPAYVGGADPGTVESRREALTGFGLAVIRPSVLLERSINPAQFRDVAAALFDLGPSTQPPSPTGDLLASRPNPASGVAAPASFGASGAVERLVFDYAGRHLGLVTVAGPAYMATSGGSAEGWGLLALGFLAALLLVAYGIGRRRIDAQLEGATARLHSVVDAAPEAFVGLDAGGSIVDWSAQASRLFGMSRDEAVGCHLAEIVTFDRIGEAAAPTPIDGGPRHASGRVRRPGGRDFPVELTMAEASEPADWAVACFIRDATDEVRAREERARVTRAEAIGELTGRVAHDFNNLLGIVVGALEGLRPRIGDDQAATEHVQAAMSAAARGAEITRALLAAARRQVLDAQDHDLRELVTDAVPLLDHAVSPGVAIRIELTDEPTLARVDATAFSNALINLARNADEAMPAGGHLAVTLSRDGGTIVVAVADDGCGMTDDVVSHALEPLFTTRPGGTGLGLAIVDEFARRSGGTATIESRAGVGTTVRLTLPASGCDGGLPGPAPTERAAADPVVPPRPDRLLVMVVDDEPILRTFAARWLTEIGYDVTTAGSAPEAMSAVEAAIEAGRPPAAIVSDVLMPGEYGGGELARRARRLLPGLAVILVSGFVGTELEPLASEGFAILEKPFRQGDLGEAIATEIERLAVRVR